MNLFRKKVQEPPTKHQEQMEGCRMKIRRNKEGRVVGYEDNGKCSKGQVELFKEQNGVED